MADYSQKYIIAISRQYGSGGRGIGKALADELKIGCYDKELISLTAERSGLSKTYVERQEERASVGFIANLSFNAYHGFDSIGYYDTPTTDRMYLSQSEVIRDIAAQGSCVIIGRCADYILRNDPGLIRIFIRAEYEDRIQRAVEEYSLDRKDAINHVKKTDKSRANYYKFYTNRLWGDPEHTDLMINSTLSGSDGAVSLIRRLLEVRGLV